MYGYSRQAFYKRKQIETQRDSQSHGALNEVRRIRVRQTRVGGRKLHLELNSRGIPIGRDRLFDLLREENLLIKKKRAFRRTTWSAHGLRTYANCIKNRVVSRPGEVIVSDITYLQTLEGFCYLFLVTDLFSRKIIGYAVRPSLEAEGALAAFRMALSVLPKDSQTIHHSDRGVQYCCWDYVNLLKAHNIQISMTEEDHVYENAVAERVNGILKDEFHLGRCLLSKVMASKMTAEAIEIYNDERLHTSLGFKTPSAVYAA